MQTFERHLIRDTKESTAKYVNALVGHMLTEEDFRKPHTGAEWEQFRSKVSDLFSLPEVVRVKIYNPEGVLLWSDSRELMETAPSARDNPELLEALEGHVEAEISSLNKEEHRFERTNFRTLMELYVPIYLRQQARPAGVAEVYLNIDPLIATVHNTRWVVGATVVGGMALLLSVTFLGLGRAVGVIQKQNQEIQAAFEEVVKTNRLKNDLVDDLRQEVRNPDAVMSYAGLLLDGAFGSVPPQLKPSSADMRNTAAELLSHFTRIVELTRLKVGDFRPHCEPVDVAALVRDIVGDLSFLCGNGAVSCRTELPNQPVVIATDRKLLQLVVVNIVTNAIKFTPRGKITVRIEENGDETPVRIIVEDTGIGMPAEELPLIFEEFYRGNHPDARFKSGVGLGLAIVKKSVEFLHGKITVESVIGKGSTFAIILPKKLEATDNAERERVSADA